MDLCIKDIQYHYLNMINFIICFTKSNSDMEINLVRIISNNNYIYINATNIIYAIKNNLFELLYFNIRFSSFYI